MSADLLVERLEAARGKLVLVVTGAGVSLASGIPTFRGSDPGAVWANSVTEMGTAEFFEKDPVASWRWYGSRFARAASAKPNAAHLALVALERWQAARGEFLLITQNVDGLHRRAGSRELVEVHGRADRVRCARDGCELGAPSGTMPRSQFDETLRRLLDDPRPEHLPRCPACGANVRPHILWFDELYVDHRDYEWQKVFHACDRSRPVIFLGTSLAVGVTDLALRCALDRCAPAVVVDPAPPDLPSTVDVIRAKVEELLPTVVERLGA